MDTGTGSANGQMHTGTGSALVILNRDGRLCMQLIHAAGLCGRIRLYTKLYTHGITTVGGVTAGLERHNSSNVGGVTAGQVRHNSSNTNKIPKKIRLK